MSFNTYLAADSSAAAALCLVLNFMVKESHNWFPVSPKHSTGDEGVYRIMKDKIPKKILRLANTRWFWWYEAVSKIIIEQYEVLKLHFQWQHLKKDVLIIYMANQLQTSRSIKYALFIDA